MLQTSGKPNHVVGATKSGYTKPCARVLAPGAQHAQNHVHTHNESPATPFHKRTTWYPFATTLATPHYPVFTDSHSPLYGMLVFLLHFMTNTFFSTFLSLSPPCSASTLLLNHTTGPIPWLLTQILVIPPPSSFSCLPDLGWGRAQRIMFLSRFLV